MTVTYSARFAVAVHAHDAYTVFWPQKAYYKERYSIFLRLVAYTESLVKILLLRIRVPIMKTSL